MENKLDFEYGDLYIICSKGHETKIGENVKTGLQFILLNKDDSNIEIHCPECDKDYKVMLKLKPALNPPIEDAVEVNEDINENDERPESISEGEDI